MIHVGSLSLFIMPSTEMVSIRRRTLFSRIVFILVLIILNISKWREHFHLMQQVKDLKNRVNVLRQMHSYSQEVCSQKDLKSSIDVNVLGELQEMKRSLVTNSIVTDELTFILLGHTWHCSNNQLLLIQQRYKNAKVIITTHINSTVDNQVRSSSKHPLVHLLGGFTSKTHALNKAIAMVSTKYFMIIDDSVDLGKIKNNFVEILLSNMPGFDILSGAEIAGTIKQFTIPCSRLWLHNWALYESYEYQVRGHILRCSGCTSLFLIARTATFKHAAQKGLFDVTLPEKWLQDLFVSLDNVIEVGIVPEVVVYRELSDQQCSFGLLNSKKPASSEKVVESILPFANKHEIFSLNDETGGSNICENTNSFVCSEESVNQKWDIGKFSSTGLTTYPFILKSLQEALHFGAKTLKEANLLYVVEGGTLLGLIKVRDILPWDHGDVDTFVYSTRRRIIDMVMKAHHQHGYGYLIRHSGFHTYVSNDSTSLNGCIVYLSRRVKPKGIIYIRYQGKLLPVKQTVFMLLRELYGATYFENRMKYTNERNYCKIPGHHACMPDCRWHGCGGGPGSYPGII